MSAAAWPRTHMSILLSSFSSRATSRSGSSSNKIKLNFNHPCKEIIFVVQPDSNVDYCSSFLKNTHLNMALGAQPFNYTDALDALVPSIAAFSGPAGVYVGPDGDMDGNAAFINQASGGMFQDPGADTNADDGQPVGPRLVGHHGSVPRLLDLRLPSPTPDQAQALPLVRPATFQSKESTLGLAQSH